MKQHSKCNVLFQVYFWIFNGALLLIAYLGLLPFIGPTFVSDTLAGELPLDFFLPLFGLVGVPTASAVMGKLPVQKRSLSLVQIFYGVETPLLLLCVIRFFILRQLNPASALVLITGCLAIGTYLHRQIKGERTDGLGSWFQLGCHILMLAIAIYLGALTLLFAIPLAWGFFVALFSIGSSSGFTGLGGIFSLTYFLIVYAFPLSIIVVVLIAIATTPFVMGKLYIQSWRQNFNYFVSRYGTIKAVLGTGTFLCAWMGLLILLQQQPQTQAFQQLEKSTQTDSERQALIQRSDKIRQGLLNAYLSRYRYADSSEDSTIISDLYATVFGLNKPTVEPLQNAYEFLFAPFLYQGSHRDSDKANKLYAEFFDAPILRAEKAEISRAVGSTFNRTEAKAGLLDINEKKVWLRSQEVTVKPQGDWADVELYEVYENKTSIQQEVVYSFSLPESAVITGVWLGNSADRSQSFPFVISPRGAAQAVYTQEVNRRIDPALLEQVAPGSYRLRAFPVVPQAQNQPLHLWMTYRVMQQNGEFTLPKLSEKRNIFWTENTKRVYNSKAVSSSQNEWLPNTIYGERSTKATLHQVDLPGGNRIIAKPLAQSDYVLPQGKRFALVLDTSRSMAAQTQETAKAFQWLKDRIAANNDLDLYVTASQGREPERFNFKAKDFDVANYPFYGLLQPDRMLQQFEKLRGNNSYDAILLITDAGSYELSDERNTIAKLPAPLWIVHLGGLQPAYDDATFDAIKASGGGVGDRIETVLQRIGTQTALDSSVISVEDGYAWSLNKTEGAVNSNDKFSPFAARQLINYLTRNRDLKQLKNLDEIHAIAKRYQIVTPYSSAIVLVNDVQRQALKQAENEGDRFQREVEDKQLPQPSNTAGLPNVVATPEPAEWMLIVIAAIALFLIWKRDRQQLVKN
ncbi:MAG: TIGR02921 family PEP-CTERM protein [Cyanosarcina radialis HA8281-LM2]|nr:TIGR02921 family PEP-CTERM protein [Cyanosarcina radialis HA8281-LM2]